MTQTNFLWQLSLEGPDPAAAARWLAQRVWQARAPQRLSIDYEACAVGADWLEKICAAARKSAAAYWPQQDTAEEASLVWHAGRVVAARFHFAGDAQDALDWLAPAPFEVAAFGSMHAGWDEIDPNHDRPGFSRGHFRHGWGCAFKGAGHRRLVSRRWLEFGGPWRLLRAAAADVSLLQFHDLDLDAAAALAQAKPAHARIGISDGGGFLQQPYPYNKPPSGLYSKQERMLRIVVTGRKLSEIEMRDACAARRDQTFGPDKPLERIAYVFTEEAAARRHLPALWLRDLECWTLRKGVEVRLDEDYRPQQRP